MKFRNISSNLKGVLLVNEDRSSKLKKNIIFMFCLRGFNILLGLIYVPIAIYYLDTEKYGLWLIVSSFFAYVQLFDIGIGHGLRNKLTIAIANGKTKLARHYVSSTYFFLAFIMLILGFIFMFVNHYLNWAKILNCSEALNQELSLLMLVIFSSFFALLVCNLINTIHLAHQNPIWTSITNLAIQSVTLIAVFILTRTTDSSLFYLGLVASLSPLFITALVSVFFFRKQYKYLKPSYSYFRFKYIKDIMSLGGKFFLIQLTSFFLLQLNNLIITQTINPSSVVHYNIAYKYIGILLMLFNIVNVPMWSAITDAYARNDLGWISSKMNRMKQLCLLFLFGGMGLILIAPFCYKLWIGDKIVVDYILLIEMLVYIALLMWSSIFTTFLNGVGKIKLSFYITLIEAIIYIPFSIILSNKFGLHGFLVAMILIPLINSIWQPVQYKFIINNKAKGIFNK